MLTRIAATACLFGAVAPALAQSAASDTTILIVPARVFDAPRGVIHDGWAVLVRGEHRRSRAALRTRRPAENPGGRPPEHDPAAGSDRGSLAPVSASLRRDAVGRSGAQGAAALRVARATVAARRTLQAGFTSERDLGTEGAGYADAGSRPPSTRGSFPVRGLPSSRARSSPPEHTGPVDSIRAGKCRRAPRRRMGWRGSPRGAQPDQTRRRLD